MPTLRYQSSFLESYQKERLLRVMRNEIYSIWGFPWFGYDGNDPVWLLYVNQITPSSSDEILATWSENDSSHPYIIIDELILNERNKLSYLKKESGDDFFPSITFIVRSATTGNMTEAKKSQILHFLNYITGELRYKKAKYFIDSDLYS